jgi:hypothetical protein
MPLTFPGGWDMRLTLPSETARYLICVAFFGFGLKMQISPHGDMAGVSCDLC